MKKIEYNKVSMLSNSYGWDYRHAVIAKDMSNNNIVCYASNYVAGYQGLMEVTVSNGHVRYVHIAESQSGPNREAISGMTRYFHSREDAEDAISGKYESFKKGTNT